MCKAIPGSWEINIIPSPTHLVSELASYWLIQLCFLQRVFKKCKENKGEHLVQLIRCLLAACITHCRVQVPGLFPIPAAWRCALCHTAGMAQAPESCHPHGRPHLSSWCLASPWPSASHCRHLGIEPVYGRTLYVPVMFSLHLSDFQTNRKEGKKRFYKF